VPIFQQSVDAGLYEWLMQERKRRKARSIQDVIRQVLREAKAEAEKHGKKWAFTDFGVEIGGKTQEDEDENSPR